MASESRIFVDSCVVINVLTGGADDEDSWLAHSQNILRRGDRGEHRLVASTLTLAEIAGAGNVRGTHLPNSERRKRVTAVRDWLDSNPRWLLVEVDQRIARQAAELAIDHQLKGPDAVMLASAIASKAKALVTWDAGLLKASGAGGVHICPPSLLPYSQADLFEEFGIE